MGIQDIQPLYKWIVDSVIAKSRAAFLQEGVDECVPSCLPHCFLPISGDVLL